MSELPHNVTPLEIIERPQTSVGDTPHLGKTMGWYAVEHDLHCSLRAELPDALSQIRAIGELPANWDGYGALPIAEETKHNAETALSRIAGFTPTPEIAPNPNGTISFEWESEFGTAHLEIGRTLFSFFISPTASDPILADGDVAKIGYEIAAWTSAMLFPQLRGASASMTQIVYLFPPRHVRPAA